jgi:hypothetical protein
MAFEQRSVRFGIFAKFSIPVLALCAAAEATAGPLDTLAAGHWYQFPNSQMQTVAPSPAPAGSIAAVMNAWSGGVYDTDRDQLVIWGGGHTDYAGNEVYAFGPLTGTPSWHRLTNPSNPPADNTPRGSDGRPVSRHTYNLLAYMPAPYNKMASCAIGAQYSNGYGGGALDFYNFTIDGMTGQPWSAGPTAPSNTYAVESYCAYNPITQRLWYQDNHSNQSRLQEYNPASNTWISHVVFSPETQATAAIDTRRNLMVAVGSGKIIVYNLNSPDSQPITATTAGPTNIQAASFPGFVYDSVNDQFVGWSGGTSVYALSIPSSAPSGTWTWTQITADTSVSPGAVAGSSYPTGTFGRFRYVPSKQGVVVVNDISQSVYFFKLPGTPATSTSGGTTGSSTGGTTGGATGGSSGGTTGGTSGGTTGSTTGGTTGGTSGGTTGGTTGSTSTPIPAGSVITSPKVVSSASSAQSQVPVTFGEVFRPGDVPSGATLIAKLSDGTTVPLQVDAKATHGDGSLRHAVLSLRIPSLAASGSTAVQLSTGTGSLSGSAIALSDLLATSFDALVDLNLGGTHYTASARSLLQSGSGLKQWLTGPVASEWIVGAAVKTSSGVAHPHLTAYFHVRAYRTGTTIDHVRVDTVVENGWTMVTGPGTFNYTATITVGGQSVYTQTVAQAHHARWHKQFWWQGAPQVNVQHDMAYLQNTKAIPAYMNVHPTDAYLNSLRQTSTPMSNGDLSQSFPDTGAQTQIGPLPIWDATYITSGADPRAYRNMLVDDDSAGSYSVHYRDETTGFPVSIVDHPSLSLQGTDLPAVSGANPNTEDGAHQPSVGFLAYLVTGDYFYMEEMQFWTSWNWLWANAGYRQGSEGIFTSQVRLQAWSLRNLAQSAYATPDNHPLKKGLVASVGYNVSNDEALYSNNPNANKLGAVASYDGYQLFAPWMDDFLTWAFSYVTDLGFNAQPIRDWKLKFPVGRMGTTAYCYKEATAYHLVTGTNDTVWYPDFATLYTANFGANTSCPTGQDLAGYPDSPSGYPSNLRPALAAAVDAGIPGATDAWARFSSAPTQPDYSNYAVWAIVPRGAGTSTGSGSGSGGGSGGGTGGTTPPPPTPAPTETFTSNAGSVVAGSQVTLTWSTANATSCTASGGWSGSKATSGSQSVGPLSTNTSFVMACSGAGGSVSQSVAVTVTPVPVAPPPAPAPTLTLTANPASITSGGQTMLQWSSTNATSCMASGGWTGTQATSGSKAIAGLTQSAAYSLTCTGTGGTVQKSASVTVTSTTPTPAAPTVAFSANPTSVKSGATTLLTWTTVGASTCYGSGAWGGWKRTQGTQSIIHISVTSTYTLTCSNKGGSSSKSVVVTVVSSTPTPTPTPTPSAGSLSGGVDSSFVNLTGTNRVYVFAGSVTPHDYNGSTSDPVASIPVVQDDNACTFRYSLASLPAGTYTIAFTSQAANDVPNQSDSVAFTGTTTVSVGSSALTHNFAPATILQVGPTRQYKTIRQAAAVMKDGSVIEVDAGDYPNDIVVWRKNGVVIRGVGTTRSRVYATAVIPYTQGNDLQNGKGLWVVQGTGTRVENMEFYNAKVTDQNGSGIRNEGRNTTICNGYFHNNENGFMGEAYGTLTIEYSTFADNGRGDGYTHNVYVGDGGTTDETLVFRHNDSSHVSVGHLLKTRARVNYILYNRLMDEQDGTSSYNVDVSNGGLTYMIGNLMQQSANTSNSTMVAYGAEGLLSGRTHALYLVNNTLVNDRGSGQFMSVASGTPTYRSLNNLFVGAGTVDSGIAPTATSNLQTSAPAFTDRANFDYHLTSTSPARDKGSSPGSAGSYSLTPVYQYVDPAGREARPVNGVLDVGAFEYAP